MRRQCCTPRILCIGVICFLIYIIVFRRRSPKVLLTASDINEYLQQKNLNNTHLRRIPRIIHQTWKTKHVPSHWNKTVETVRQFNADQFEYRLWTDDDMHEFVRQKEPYLYKHTFLSYRLDIQRVDAFRYILLYHLGGIYIDMDNGCRQSFDSLINVLEEIDSESSHLTAYTRTIPVGVSNGFMISTKGHPLYKILISRLSLFNHNYLIDYLTVMISAGPLFLSINEFYFDKSSTQSAIRIMDEIVYSTIYTWHGPGRSWHGRDGQLIMYTFESIRDSNPTTFYRVVIVISLIPLLILYWCYKKRFNCKRTKC